MAKKSKRIAPWHLKKIFARGQIWRGKFFNAKTFIRTGEDASKGYRLVVVVSKKTLAKAHDRNLCRRRVKSAFLESKGVADGYDMVIFPDRRVINCDFAELKVEAKKCLDALQSTR
jgi:ribonuclease P protein component